MRSLSVGLDASGHLQAKAPGPKRFGPGQVTGRAGKPQLSRGRRVRPAGYPLASTAAAVPSGWEAYLPAPVRVIHGPEPRRGKGPGN